MSISRISLIWPLLIIAAALLWIVQATGTLPPVVSDLVGRSWPVLLVVVGLMLLLGRRVRFGNTLSLVLSAVLVGGIVVAAYGQASGRVLTENHKPFTQVIDSSVSTIEIQLRTLTTNVQIEADGGAATPSGVSQSTISGEFVGGPDSVVTSDYQIDGDRGTFTLVETQPSPIPSLASAGRSTLTIHIPSGVTIDQVNLTGQSGDMTMDISSSAVKNFTVAVGSGNLDVKLPNISGLIGDIKTGHGDATVTVPQQIAANISIKTGTDVQYSQTDYTLSIDRVLVSKRSAAPQMQISIDAPGKITVQ